MSEAMTPRETVEALDKYIVGQDEAKRAVAIALRNRYRRSRLPQELRDEITPKNIIMMGPTGVGKTALARALAVSPKILLMDEPTSALDPISTGKIEELCMELKENVTILIVTHNMQQAARISDNTAFFLLGELVEFGKTEQVFSTPADKRTEDYITGRFG